MIQNNADTNFGLTELNSPVPVPVLGAPAAASITQGAVQKKEQAVPCENLLKLSMVTPWQQECGNAVYADRLCTALSKFSHVTAFDLRNFTEDFELRSKSKARAYFDGLIKRVNGQAADIVHVQHEFCFFGRSIQRSNREFLRFVSKIRQPIVLTIHTWLDRSTTVKKKKLSVYFKRPLESLRAALQRKVYYKALCRCEAIVVHTHDTHALLVNAYPKLRNKIHIIQIPIAAIESQTTSGIVQKAAGDVWIVLPGFVCPYKGHRHAVNALEYLPHNYKLVIAGGRHPKDRAATRYWMELLTEIEKRRLQSRVIFTGFMKAGSQQAAVLKQADLFLLPYEEVGQSGSAVLADAIAYDRPVVTSRARSMFAYRMSQATVYSSLSMDVSDAEALACSIIDSLKTQDCKSEVSSHRKAAIEQYSSARIALEYERLYKDVRSKKT